LAPPPQKMTKPDLQIPVDPVEGRSGIPKPEVAAPAPQKPVDRLDHLGKRQLDGSARQSAQPFPHAVQGLGRGHELEIPPARHEPTAITATGKAQKVQALPRYAQVHRPGFVPVLEPELRLQLGLAAQLPSQQGDFQGQTGLRFKPFFRRGASAQAGFPPLMKTRSKSCPLAPRGLAASSLLWAGPTPGQDRKAGYGFPAPFELGLPVALPALPGLPGSLTILRIPAATTPDGPTPCSCYPLAPIAGFPTSWEGRRRHDLY